MAEPKIQIDVRSPKEGITILDMRGQITGSAEDMLFAAYSTAGSEARTIILNLSRVQSIDSLGAGLLITLLARVNKRKQQLLAYGLNEHCRRAFQLTHLDQAIGIYADEAKVLESIR
jgi:anti-anti-sigma factor